MSRWAKTYSQPVEDAIEENRWDRYFSIWNITDETVSVLKNDDELPSVIAVKLGNLPFWGIVPEVASHHHVESHYSLYRERTSEMRDYRRDVTVIVAVTDPGSEPC